MSACQLDRLLDPASNEAGAAGQVERPTPTTREARISAPVPYRRIATDSSIISAILAAAGLEDDSQIRILRAVVERSRLEEEYELTHERIARHAGVSLRSVERHLSPALDAMRAAGLPLVKVQKAGVQGKHGTRYSLHLMREFIARLLAAPPSAVEGYAERCAEIAAEMRTDPAPPPAKPERRRRYRNPAELARVEMQRVIEKVSTLAFTQGDSPATQIAAARAMLEAAQAFYLDLAPLDPDDGNKPFGAPANLAGAAWSELSEIDLGGHEEEEIMSASVAVTNPTYRERENPSTGFNPTPHDAPDEDSSFHGSSPTPEEAVTGEEDRPRDDGDELQAALSRLEGVRRLSTGGYIGRCPLHPDEHASLHVSRGDRRRLLFRCFAGCDGRDLLTWFNCGAPPVTRRPAATKVVRGRPTPGAPARGRGRIEATYVYRSAEGADRYRLIRYEGKQFSFQRREADGWRSGMDGVDRLLYKLPELLSADPGAPVLIAESEKSINALLRAGFVATGGGGANGWKAHFNGYLRNRHVVLLPDNDRAGAEWGAYVAESLTGTAATVRILELPGLEDGADAFDFLSDHGSDALRALLDGADAATGILTPARAVVGARCETCDDWECSRH